jgi:uncharacterized protein (DUF433 family)
MPLHNTASRRKTNRTTLFPNLSASIADLADRWYCPNKEKRETKPLDRITIDPEFCLGQPTIRGMRITGSLVVKLIASGMSCQEILEAYPDLEGEDITQALEY